MIRINRLLRAAAASALIVPATGTLWAAAAQPRLADQVEGVFAIGIPRAEDASGGTDLIVVANGPTAADVQAVWNLAATGSWDTAIRRLQNLEAANTNWQAPANLKSYLANGQRDARIQSAVAAKDWEKVLALLPAARDGACEPQPHLWARAAAVEGQGTPAQVDAFYLAAFANCTDTETLAALAGRALPQLSVDGLAAAAKLESLGESVDAKIVLAHQRIVREAAWRRFDAAVISGDLETAVEIADHSKDPRVLAQAGWSFLDQDPARAADYFESALAAGSSDEASRGLVLATLAAGDLTSARRAIAQVADGEQATSLAARIDLADAEASRRAGDWQSAVALAASAVDHDPELSPSANAVAGGALVDAAATAYEAGDYAGARALADQAASYAPTRRAGLMRAAWSDLQLGNASAAASAFSRLYLDVPDTESAEGYALAAEKSGDLGTAAALGRALGGPLGSKVEARYAAVAFNQGDYLTARAHAPQAYDALEGIDHTWYRQAVSVRNQAGTRGESRMRGFVSTTSVGTARGANRFEAGVAVYTLDPGRSTSSAIAASRETFAAPYVAWSREGDVSLAARIGLLPVGTDADPQVTGEIAIAHEEKGRAIEGRVFARPKAESVLALAGQDDAVSGDTFGRVTETGALVRGRLPVGKTNALQADVSAAHLDGQNTDDNAMVSVGVAASHTIAHEGFAYLVTGPFYQFQSYDKNTNVFTPGHGGYFSPQAFHRAGWSVNAQTDPLKKWILKTDAAVAHESVKEDAALANPLGPAPQALIGGGKSSGIAGALDIAAARRVSSEVIVSANLSAIASQAYEDVRVGVALTWVPGGRAGLVRADLPSDPFTPASWVQP